MYHVCRIDQLTESNSITINQSGFELYFAISLAFVLQPTTKCENKQKTAIELPCEALRMFTE